MDRQGHRSPPIPFLTTVAISASLRSPSATMGDKRVLQEQEGPVITMGVPHRVGQTRTKPFSPFYPFPIPIGQVEICEPLLCLLVDME